MDELLTCTICLETYNNKKKTPLSLICGHTFCHECLSLISQQAAWIVCPVDKTKENRSLSSIPKNYSLLDIIELMSSKSKPKLPTLISDKSTVINECKTILQQLLIAKKVSSEEEEKSLSELDKGFNIIRECLSYRESELTNSIKQTHSNLNSKLSSLYDTVASISSLHESDLTTLKSLQSTHGDSYDALPSFCTSYPDLSQIDSVLSMTQKLPIKILLSPNNIENSINSFTKVIDDTQCRVSDLTAVFVADIRVRDNDRFMSQSTFVKTWRIKNDGDKAWPNNSWCVFSHGAFGGESVVVDPAWPGEEVDISVVLTAPAEPGKHLSYWKLVDPSGVTFGPNLWVDIEVYTI